MATPEHEKLEELFRAALERGSDTERAAFLNEACGNDTALRAHVEGLLRVHGRASSFLEVPPVDPDATIESWAPGEITGTRVGRYKLLQELGEGGFGTVYMAEQEEPVRRKVALKIIKLGMDTKQVIARFEAERQALALMDHPNIAHVLDAGATETGRPYFVMELVKGITVTEYCDKHKLSTRQRLELLVPVCHAVQHAHQKGVIHRDLKPNNVLVTLDDNQPVPKVIDFGIAKATSQRLTEKTLFTEFRQFLGTPEYMSPDQAEISGLDVDTRTDIYSLGVLLYELLTGTTPFDAKTLRSAGFDEIKRIIREVEPPRPSTRLQTLSITEQGTAIARLRQTEPASLSRLTRGDLDWIAMKAMEKDRTRRYATAKDLADDIERHLRNEPVLAGPPGAAYKFRKFVRRNRVGVLAGSVVAAAVLIGLSLATGGLIHANRARDALQLQRDAAERARADALEQSALAKAAAEQARAEAAESATTNEFLQKMLSSVNPYQALGREVTVRYILDEAAREIDEGALTEHPEVEASVRMTLGETYLALGLYAAAEAQLGAAEEICKAQFGDEHPETLGAGHALAQVLRVKGRFAEAEALLRRIADTQRRVLGEEHPDTLATMSELALALWGPGRFDEAEAIRRPTLEIQRRVLGEHHPDTLKSVAHLGAVCRVLGKYAEAEALLLRALEQCQRVLGGQHPCTAEAMNNLALLREDQGNHEAAEELFRRIYELDRRVLGLDHPQTLIRSNNLLRTLQNQGKLAEMRPLVEERLDHLKRAAQRDGADALALHAYAWELLNCEPVELRDPEAALLVAQQAVQLDGERDAGILETLALAFEMTGDLDRAVGTQRQAVVRAQVGGPYNRAEMEARLVDLLVANGDPVGAMMVSWEGLAQEVGESLISDPALGASAVRRSQVLMDEGRYEDAADQLRGCLATRQKELEEGHFLIADTMSRLGAAVAGTGSFAEAESLLLEGYAGLENDRRTPPEYKREAVARIVRLYEAWDEHDAQAAEWRRRVEAMPGDAASQE